MFSGTEIKKYAELLHILNEQQNLPAEYSVIINGGGTDGIPHFKLVHNETQNTFIIWVRGTNFFDPNDILINMKVTPIPLYGGTCHKGYFYAAMKILKIIIDVLQNVYEIQHIPKFVCLGHSLGGAVSSIIATILTNGDNGQIHGINPFKNIIDNIEAYVFGTPPVFSTAISIQSRNFVRNIILKDDIVPKLSTAFNSFLKLQKRILIILMYNTHALGNSIRAQNAFSNAINLINNNNINYADKLPGNVLIIDPKTRTILINNGNSRKINNFIDILGIFQHTFVQYIRVIRIINRNNYAIVNNNNNIIVVEIRMSKSQKFWIAFGIATTGIAAYLTAGAAIAYGVISAIASS